MIHYQFDGRVARLTLDTPETGNHFTRQLLLDFIASLRHAEQDHAQVLLISAKGGVFTWGRDQKERLPNVPLRDNLGLILQANAALRGFSGVSISLIDGPALGFGSGIALHSSITLATERAEFGFDEIDHNLAPLIVVAYLPHFISPRIAEELVLTGRRVPAQEAQQLGIVTRVVSSETLKEEAAALIDNVQRYPGAVRTIRRYIQALPGYPSAALNQKAIDDLASWVEQGRPY